MLLTEDYFDKKSQAIEEKIHLKRVERNWKLTGEEITEIIKEGLMQACADQVNLMSTLIKEIK